MSQLPLSIHWPTLSLTCPFFHRTQSENCFHFLSILHSFGIFPKYNCHFTDRLFSDTPFLQWHSVTEMLQMQCNWSTLTLAFVLRHPLPHCPNYLFPPSVPHWYHFNQTLKAPFLGLRSDLKSLLVVLWEGFLYQNRWIFAFQQIWKNQKSTCCLRFTTWKCNSSFIWKFQSSNDLELWPILASQLYQCKCWYLLPSGRAPCTSALYPPTQKTVSRWVPPHLPQLQSPISM